MPIVTPTLNLPQPSTTSSTKTASPAIPAAAPIAAPVSTASTPAAPSTTVTLSPQALSLAAASHPASSSTPGATAAPTPAPVAHDGSVYESLKNGISSAVNDVEDAIASGANAVVDGVEHTLSTANDIAKGILELPFAVVAKSSDAVGALIDKL
jgi:hypothetical protein